MKSVCGPAYTCCPNRVQFQLINFSWFMDNSRTFFHVLTRISLAGARSTFIPLCISGGGGVKRHPHYFSTSLALAAM